MDKLFQGLIGFTSLSYSDIVFIFIAIIAIILLIVCFSRIHKQRKREDYSFSQEIIRALSSDFEGVFLVNVDEDSVRSIRLTMQFMNDFPSDTKEKTYSGRARESIERNVLPEDISRVIQSFDAENVYAQLLGRSSYYCTFRAHNSNDVEIYYQAKFVRLDTDTNQRAFILGISNVDSHVRDQLRAEEEQLRVKEELENMKRTELEHRAKALAEAKANAEKTVARQTAELREKNSVLNQISVGVVDLLGDVVESRDAESGEHIQRVKGFTYILANKVRQMLPEYGLTDEIVHTITFASALHDVGKIAIPDGILLKPGRLTREEYKVMQTHCERGCEILKKMSDHWSEEYLRICTDIVYCHHEKWDGNGYPRGLKGDEIPISAQIVSLADVYDALTSGRVYKEAYTCERAFNMILAGDCGAFSNKLLSCFIACREDFEMHVQHPDEFTNADVMYESRILLKPEVTNRTFEMTKILLVDDDSLSREINRDILENECAVVFEASSGLEAVETLRSDPTFDLVLIDIVMPEVDGIATTELIRKMENEAGTEHVPIVAITAEASDARVEDMLRAGANECMNKPLVISELSGIYLAIMRQKHALMEKKLQDTIRVANTDPLTQTKNIAAYTDMISALTAKMNSSDPLEFAVVMCDINNLKKENDTYGHNSGDIYIKNCANVISRVFANSPVYRIGGDEFVVILQGADLHNMDFLMATLAEKEKETAQIPTAAEGKASFAIGMAVFDEQRDHAIGDTVKRADIDMYTDKKAKKIKP